MAAGVVEVAGAKVVAGEEAMVGFLAWVMAWEGASAPSLVAAVMVVVAAEGWPLHMVPAGTHSLSILGNLCLPRKHKETARG